METWLTRGTVGARIFWDMGVSWIQMTKLFSFVNYWNGSGIYVERAVP